MGNYKLTSPLLHQLNLTNIQVLHQVKQNCIHDDYSTYWISVVEIGLSSEVDGEWE